MNNSTHKNRIECEKCKNCDHTGYPCHCKVCPVPPVKAENSLSPEINKQIQDHIKTCPNINSQEVHTESWVQKNKIYEILDKMYANRDMIDVCHDEITALIAHSNQKMVEKIEGIKLKGEDLMKSKPSDMPTNYVDAYNYVIDKIISLLTPTQ